MIATPHRPQTSGAIERNGRRVVEVARCALLQAGFRPKWWPRAVRYFFFASNTTRIVRDEKLHGSTVAFPEISFLLVV